MKGDLVKKILSILLAVLMFGSAGILTAAPYAQRNSSVRKAALQTKHRETIRQLQLSPEQQQRLQTVKRDYHKQVAEINAKIHVRNVELEDEMAKPAPDVARVKQLTREIGELKASRDLERLKAKRETDKILTSEQLEKLRAIENRQKSEEEEGDAPAE